MRVRKIAFKYISWTTVYLYNLFHVKISFDSFSIYKYIINIFSNSPIQKFKKVYFGIFPFPFFFLNLQMYLHILYAFCNTKITNFFRIYKHVRTRTTHFSRKKNSKRDLLLKALNTQHEHVHITLPLRRRKKINRTKRSKFLVFFLSKSKESSRNNMAALWQKQRQFK